MSTGVERRLYRVRCRGCGHTGRVEVVTSEWGWVSAKWGGFAAGRLAHLRPQDGARCGRCGSRDSVAAEQTRAHKPSGAHGPRDDEDV